MGEEHGVEVRWIDLGGRFEKGTAGMVMLRLVGGDGGHVEGESTWQNGWRRCRLEDGGSGFH